MSKQGKEKTIIVTKEDCEGGLDKNFSSYARAFLSEMFWRTRENTKQLPESFLLKSKEKQLDRLKEILTIIVVNSRKLTETELSIDNFLNLLKISLEKTEFKNIDIIEDNEIDWPENHPLITLIMTPNKNNMKYFYTYIFGFSLEYNSHNQICDVQFKYRLYRKELVDESKNIFWLSRISDHYLFDPSLDLQSGNLDEDKLLKLKQTSGEKNRCYGDIPDDYDPKPKPKEVLIDSVELAELRKQLKRYKY